MRIFMGFVYGGLLAFLIAIPLEILLANVWVDPEDPLGLESTWRDTARQFILVSFIAIGAMLGAFRGWQKSK